MIYLFGIIVTLLIASFIPSVDGKSAVSNISNKNMAVGNFLKLLCMMPMLLISALRFNVGSDFLAVYWNGFQRVQAGINTDNFEIGFQSLIKLLGKISYSPQILIIITSFLFVFFTWNAIYEQSNDIIFSLLILFISRYYFISLNVIRQLIAMAIILYALKYLKEGKNIKYIIFNLIAFTIHRSALICLVFLLIKKI
ncbi:EpsG family protein, partial [Lactobacillus helveticus]